MQLYLQIMPCVSLGRSKVGNNFMPILARHMCRLKRFEIGGYDLKDRGFIYLPLPKSLEDLEICTSRHLQLKAMVTASPHCFPKDEPTEPTRIYLLVCSQLTLIFIMSQPLMRTIARKPVASLNASPDTSRSHLLTRTRNVQGKAAMTPDNRVQKIPLLQEISVLSQQNQRLKLRLDNQTSELRAQIENKDKELTELRGRLSEDKSDKRKYLSATSPLTQSVRQSTQKKKPIPPSQTDEVNQIEQLRSRNVILGSAIQELKRDKVSRSVVSHEPKKPDIQLSNLKLEALNLDQRIQKLYNFSELKIKNLEIKVLALERVLSIQRAERLPGLVNSNQKISLISPKKGSTISKRESMKYSTPIKQGQSLQRTVNELQTQLMVSKNHVAQLQRQNNLLVEEIDSIGASYQQVLKKSGKSVDPNRNRQKSFESQSHVNYIMSENQSLIDTLKSVRMDLQRSANDAHQLRLKLASIQGLYKQSKIQLQRKAQFDSPNNREYRLQDVGTRMTQQQRTILELERSISLITKQRDAAKAQLLVTQNSGHSLVDIHQLQGQKTRAEEENKILRQNVQELSYALEKLKKGLMSDPMEAPRQTVPLHGNQNLETLWNQLVTAKKQVEVLGGRNRDLEKQLQFKNAEGNPGLGSLAKLKDDEISRLRQELDQKLTDMERYRQLDTQNEGIQSQFNHLKSRLQEADRMLQKTASFDSANLSQVQSTMRSLQDLKFMLDRVNFGFLEAGLAELGGKYKSLVQQKINLLRSTKESTFQISRLNSDNDRIKKQAVASDAKFVNQKSQRQRLESVLNMQKDEVRILKDQVSRLNGVLNQYITKQQTVTVRTPIQQGSTMLVEGMAADSQTQKSMAQLRDLERQFKAVTGKLTDITAKIGSELEARGLRNTQKSG